MFSIFSLPPIIDQKVAVKAFRSQREQLFNLVCHCLPSLTNALFAKDLISKVVKETAFIKCLGESYRTGVLLDCVEDKIEAMPENFAEVVDILESEQFLGKSIKDKLVNSYSE